MPSSQNALTFQELILSLQDFWASQGCVLQQPYDVEVGAGTMSPETFLRVLGPKPYRVGYVQPSRRPADGRYGENPNRLYKHTQYQVILKPPPANVQELYLESLKAIGIDLRKHDIKFEEDNWESPTLGAWGIGWQVMLDGLEITQFTYFQQCGGIDLDPMSAELTYGLERIAAFLQDVDTIYDITWVVGPDGAREVRRDSPAGRAAILRLQLREGRRCESLAASAAVRSGVPGTRGRVQLPNRTEPRRKRKNLATKRTRRIQRRIERRFPVLAAFDLCLKCSHLFNILDARGAISVTERVGVIARIRTLAVGVAKAYVDQQVADTKGEAQSVSKPDQVPVG